MRYAPYTRRDFDQGPFLVFYEVTRACDLACRHCRACAERQGDPDELNTGLAKRLIRQIAMFDKRPLLVLTGGDPLKRPDLFELISHARAMDLTVALTPSATSLATAAAISHLQRAGVSRLAISLDGADAATHDAFRGVAGSFERTIQIMRIARALAMPMQINTTITRRNVDQIDRMAQLLAGEQIVMWSVFFLIPIGRGIAEQRITGEQFEHVFERLWHHSAQQPYTIKTTEAPHYRRFVLEKGVQADLSPRRGRRHEAPLGVNDGRGVMFVSHTGGICPSGFLPIECGTYPDDSVVEVYRHHPLFKALRDPDRLKDKCGECEYRHICGGSRARAFAVTGDPLAAEPDCDYLPMRWRREVGSC